MSDSWLKSEWLGEKNKNKIQAEEKIERFFNANLEKMLETSRGDGA